MTSFCLGAAEKTHLQLPAASTRVNFFPYGMDSKAEGRGEWRSPSQARHPSLPQHGPSTALFPNISGAISQYAFSKGNNFRAHIGGHCSTRLVLRQPWFQNQFPSRKREKANWAHPQLPKPWDKKRTSLEAAHGNGDFSSASIIDNKEAQ